MSQAKRWIPTMLSFVFSMSVWGCGSPPQAPPALREATVQTGRSSEDPAAALVHWHSQMHSRLDLSAEQRARFQAIVTEHLRVFPAEQAMAAVTRLRAAILQPTMDQAAVRSAWVELENLMKGFTPHLVAIAVAARPILTPKQHRQAIALAPEATEQFKALSNPLRDQGFEKMADGLDLSPSQAQGWAALKALDKTLDDLWLDRMAAAKVRFFEDGDSAALAASLQGMFDNTGSEETISWMSTLTLSQRQRLVQNTKAYMESLQPLLQAMLAMQAPS